MISLTVLFLFSFSLICQNAVCEENSQSNVILNRDDQCKLLTEDETSRAVKTSERLCNILYCIVKYKDGTDSKVVSPVPNGTTCGVGRFCQNEKCVPIPDFHFSESESDEVPTVTETPENINRVDRDQQCQKLTNDHTAIAIKSLERSCKVLFCEVIYNGVKDSKSESPVPNGTTCGDGNICINEKCVPSP